MPGPIPSSGSDGAPQNQNPAGDGQDTNTQPSGTGPAKPDKGSEALDFTSLPDDAFGKVFEDQRLWNHPRFKQLNEAAQAGKEAQTKLNEIEEANLKAKGEFEQLANKKGEEAAEWKNKYERQIVDNKIALAAQQLGAVDGETVLALIDRSLIKVTDAGVSGVEEALMKLKETKAFLFGAAVTPNVGGSTNPAGDPNVKKFKLSEIQDPDFYRANEKDILVAMKTPGGVEMDVPGFGFNN